MYARFNTGKNCWNYGAGMKLAFCLFKYFPYGGLQRDFLGIVEECLRRGHQVDVYALEWHGEVPPQVHLYILPSHGFTNHNRYSQFAKDFGNELTKHDYDIVIGFNKMPYLDIYYAADPCYEAMARRLRRWFYRIGPRYNYFSRLERSVFGPESTAKILVIAKGQQEDIIEYYNTPEKRFFLLPPWITQDRIPPENKQQIRKHLRDAYSIKDDEYLILMIGSGFKTKGLDRALIAIANLPETIKQKTHFIIIGHDKPNPFVNQANKLGIQDRVRFLGGRTDAPLFLFSADLLIHPAYNESAGIVILEAITAGLPVLVTDICGYAFHVAEANAGIILESPFKQQKLDQTLEYMLTSDEKYTWQENALNYSNGKDFFDMPKKAVDTIEQLSREIYCVRQPKILLKLRADLRDRWQGDDAFAQILALEGEVFRELGGRKTLRFEHNNEYYFAKLHYGVGWKEIFKNILQFRFPVLGAKNEWVAIERLEQLNIDTMKMVGYGMRGKNPATLKSFILTEALPNTISLEDFTRDWRTNPPSFKLKLALLRKVSEISRKLHFNGVNHRDFYICHMLLEVNEQQQVVDLEKITLFLIDLHRVQIRKVTPLRWIIKDLGSLFYSVMNIGLTKKDIFRFIKLYQDRSLRDSLLEDQLFWQQVYRRGLKLYGKGYKFNPDLPTVPHIPVEESYE